MNTSTKLFNAIENANLKKVRAIVLTSFREKDGRVDAGQLTALTNSRATTCDATPIHLACCLYRKATLTNDAKLASVYNSIIEVLVRDGYASLTTMMNRNFNRRTGHYDDSTGTTIFQMFRGCLPPFVQMYIKTVDMTTYEKHTATIN